MIRIAIISLILFLWIAWLFGLIMADAFGLNLHTSAGRYATAGSFGDSFGPISALMATIAATGAYLAFFEQQKLYKIDRFERNFFGLVENLELIVSQATVNFGAPVSEDKKVEFKYSPLSEQINYSSDISFQGRQAFSIILFMIRENIGPDGFSDIKRVGIEYNKIFDSYVGVLAHYFRTVYHIYRMIDERCPTDKEYYSRIVRAGLSNSELRLIAYTCTVGLGRKRFKRLLQRYSVLHNIHRSGLDECEIAELNFFQRKIPESAFRFEPVMPITYDD